VDNTPDVEKADQHYFDHGLWHPWLLWPADTPSTVFNISNVLLGDFCSLTQKFTFTLCSVVLWHVDALVGYVHEISRCTTAVTEWQLHKQTCSHGNNWTTTMRNSVFCTVHAEVL
jgi:hypothetical protein